MTAPLRTSVAVIGGGIAGLAAARALTDAGIATVIIEASARIGGRIRTDRSFGAPVNLGAEWIHGPIGNPITSIGHAAGTTMLCADDLPFPVYGVSGQPYPEAVVTRSYDDFDTLRAAARTAARPGQSLLTAVQTADPAALSDPLMRMHIAIDMEFDAGGAIDALDAIEWDNDVGFAGGDLMIIGGYDRIVQHVAAGLDIRVNSLVTRIVVHDQGVAIEATGLRIAADACICAVPLGVLRAQAIDFEPALPPAIRTAIERIGIGHANKIALRLVGDWPNDAPLFIGNAQADGRYPYVLNLNAHHPGCGLIVTYAVGATGAAQLSRNDADIKSDMATLVDRLFGHGRLKIADMIVTRWGHDPFTRGSYSFAAIGTDQTHFRSFADAAPARLAFAGEHSSADHRGTVHGAWLSGIAAAQQTRQNLGSVSSR